jgi:hypothetical protein
MSISSRQSLDIMYKMNEVDVLKTKILASIANLYDNMTPGNSDPDELADALGDVVLYTFLLGKKTGFDFDRVREEACHKIRLLLISDYTDVSNDDLCLLAQYLGA